MTATIEPQIIFGDWSEWGPKYLMQSELMKLENVHVERDPHSSRKNPLFRYREIFFAPAAPAAPAPPPPPTEALRTLISKSTRPVELDPEPNGHPRLIGDDGVEFPWLTEYAGFPVPQDHDTQLLAWRLNILRQDLDLDWEKLWVYFVSHNHKGDMVSAVQAVRRNRAKPFGVGSWTTTWGFVSDQVNSWREKFGDDEDED